MRKNKIRLTESQLHKLVKKSVKSFINEGGNLTWKDDDGRMHTNSQDNWYGIEGATFVSHGEWSDGEIYFDYEGEQYVINANDAEEWLWNDFKEYCEENNLNPDEHSDDEIWYNFARNEGYDVLLNLGPYNESYEMNESKKRKVRLTESQLHNIVKKTIAKILNESQTVRVGEYNIKFDDDNKTIISVNGWGVRDQQSAIKTMGEDVYQQALQHLNGGYMNEAYSQPQYANLAGQANGALSTWGGKIKGIFNPQWKARKQRQEKLFGNTAVGLGDNNSVVGNEDFNDPYLQQSNDYDYDNYHNYFTKNDKKNPFVIRRGQWNDGGFGKNYYGPKHNQTITRHDLLQKHAYNDLNSEQYQDNASDLAHSNYTLNAAYSNGRSAAMGNTTEKNHGTGTQNTNFQRNGEGNKRPSRLRW